MQSKDDRFHTTRIPIFNMDIGNQSIKSKDNCKDTGRLNMSDINPISLDGNKINWDEAINKNLSLLKKLQNFRIELDKYKEEQYRLTTISSLQTSSNDFSSYSNATQPQYENNRNTIHYTMTPEQDSTISRNFSIPKIYPTNSYSTSKDNFDIPLKKKEPYLKIVPKPENQSSGSGQSKNIEFWKKQFGLRN
ncbi:MAG TPA: hypothetical protein P5543_08175 [Planctomycetota bacterium]|nr:hypothetical protein [Planctomycetota bacterium]HRU52152.1 hypothetical protein [Planctomycetota bacterium]